MANSKWLDYEGLEYYTGKLDNKLENYAKISDLSNYVTSSALSSQLGNYLPISGGTLTGELKMGETGFAVTVEGHIVLASGIEIY